MTPTKQGQIVKFHTPLEDENPNQLYVVTDIFLDKEIPVASIQALGTGLSFPPISKVKLKDINVEEVETADLIGTNVCVLDDKNQQFQGKVISAKDEKILLDMDEKDGIVFTNVWLSIADSEGNQHSGNLLVKA
ncbi:hypothetical protein PQ459_13935 [Chryseobacterium sp. KACC 21268]|nr:hypothetical protein PQ459_13935 [Chryseobacterium sp. KACC 21268]